MKKKFSFTRYEREILPNFRQKISKAESTEDVKKFFVYTVKELFKNVFEGQMEFVYEEFELTPDSESHTSKRFSGSYPSCRREIPISANAD